MSLEIIIGSMYSGKSTELIKRYNNYSIKYNNIILITHKIDNRYNINNYIVTHKKQKMEAIKLYNLNDIDKKIYNNSKFILIDESQFFNDLEDFVKKSLNDNKHIIISGLNGDCDLKPFINITNLIPYADKITHLTSICHDCKELNNGFLHYKINKNNKKRISIGSIEQYKVLCRKHFKIINGI